MEKDVAKSFLPLVNDPKLFELLVEYSEYRVARLKDSLCIAGTLEDVQKLQGAIREASLLKTLKDQVRMNSK